MMLTAKQIIKLFAMKPLSNEGGFYVETYRAKETFRIGSGRRNLSTAILYLLTSDTISKLHRVESDEIFHFYLGDPVTMLQLHPNGKSEVVILGHDILKGRQVQVLVPKGTWQGCLLAKSGKFALMATTVSPGFDFADFELGDRKKLLAKFPSQRELITKLT